jgi:uncharacterized membrane protein
MELADPGLLHRVGALVETWAAVHNDTPWVQTLVSFSHFGGLLTAGGFAIATDRATLRAFGRDTAFRNQHLADVQPIHRIVVAGLIVVVVSGLLLFGADVQRFLTAPMFWIKMLLVIALLGNGVSMVRAEASLRSARPGVRRWNRLRTNAILSLTLWFATLLAGTALSIL